MAKVQNSFSFFIFVMSIFFYDLMYIIFKTDFGVILIMQYSFVFSALMIASGPCMATQMGVQPQEQASSHDQAPGGPVQPSMSDAADGAEPVKKTEKPKYDAEKSGIEDLLNRMPEVKMEKAKKAYQTGLKKCSEKEMLQFLKTTLESLRWWKDIEEKDKAEIKKQTKQEDEDNIDEEEIGATNYRGYKNSHCVDLDKEFLDKIAGGKAKQMASARAALDAMLKEVKKGKTLKKIEKVFDKKLKKKKYSKQDYSLLDDYGYDSSAGDEYEEGDSLSEEMDVEYSLEDDADFRVNDFQLDGDSVDTTRDWEEAKNNPWDGKKSADNGGDDAEEEDEDTQP